MAVVVPSGSQSNAYNKDTGTTEEDMKPSHTQLVVQMDAKQPLGIRHTLVHPVRVIMVRPGSQADQLGIKEGMKISKFNGTPINSDADFTRELAATRLQSHSAFELTLNLPEPEPQFVWSEQGLHQSATQGSNGLRGEVVVAPNGSQSNSGNMDHNGSQSNAGNMDPNGSQSNSVFTDRVTKQTGAVALQNPHQLRLVMNAEIEGLDCLTKFFFCTLGQMLDKERSYLYVRENSIEQNIALLNLWKCGQSEDHIWVEYFDQPPFQSGPCDNSCQGKPEVRVLESGCMCCCMKISCGKTYVVASPQMPFPCCSCANTVGKCDNCCGLMGRITGNPKLYNQPVLQPKDPEKFVNAVMSVLSTFKERGGDASVSDVTDVESAVNNVEAVISTIGGAPPEADEMRR